MKELSSRYGVKVKEIYDWNYIVKEDDIETGYRIILKKGGGHTPKYHSIQRMQYISHLTRLYGIRTSQLCLWNNKPNPNYTYLGEIVRVG